MGLVQVAGHNQRRIDHIFIELTNVCNFNCVFCPNEVMTRRRGFMDPDLAKALVDHIADTGLTKSLMFHLMGEPFLHRHWFEIFAHSVERDLAVTFGTNCSKLYDETSGNLFSLPITHMILSLQTPTPETFRLRRARGLTFDDFIALVKGTIRKKFEMDNAVSFSVDLLNTNPFVRRLIDLRSDIRVLEDDDEAKDVVADWVEFAKAVIHEWHLDYTPPTTEDIRSLSLRTGFAFEILPDVKLISRKATNWANTLTNRSRVFPGMIGGCSALQGQCGVLWNGDVVLCCGDFDGNTVIGNVTESRLLDILESDYARSLLRGFRLGLMRHPYCRRCRGGTTLRSLLARQIGTFLVHTLRLYTWGDQELVTEPKHRRPRSAPVVSRQAQDEASPEALVHSN